MNAVKEAAKTAVLVKGDKDQETIQNEINSLTLEINRLVSMQSGLYGVEADAATKISNQIAQLKPLLDSLNLSLRQARIAHKYRRLSMEPLRWRDDNGLPRLAVFSLKIGYMWLGWLKRSNHDPGECEDCCRKKTHHKNTFSIQPSNTLPSVLSAYYDDVGKRVVPFTAPKQVASQSATQSKEYYPISDFIDFLTSSAFVFKKKDKNKPVKNTPKPEVKVDSPVINSIGCKFEGIIPDHIRVKINEATQDGLSVFIITEPQWQINPDQMELMRKPKLETYVVNPQTNTDPLVVGYNPSIDPEAFWLIADFDVTPVELAMLTDSARRPAK